MSLIVYPQTEGNIALILPSNDVNGALKDIPFGVNYLIIDSVPSDFDDSFFECYDFHPTQGIVPNIPKAQAQQLNYWRTLREPLFAKLDINFMKSQERNDTVAQGIIVAQKQALRDVTNLPLPSDTIANIKATIPSILTQEYNYPNT